jgi:hypothetical protein
VPHKRAPLGGNQLRKIWPEDVEWGLIGEKLEIVMHQNIENKLRRVRKRREVDW